LFVDPPMAVSLYCSGPTMWKRAPKKLPEACLSIDVRPAPPAPTAECALT
jgi:hypothetical protein